MKKRLFLILTAAVLLLTSCSANQSNNSNEANTPQNSDIGILSSFSADTLSGDTVTQSILSDYNLTMVNVWATFCSPCIREMPDLGKLADEYKDNGVQIIGLVSDVLNSDGSPSQNQIDTANDIVNQTKANYIHLIPSKNLLSLLSQINSVPTTFFVDKDGNQVGEVYVGSKSKADWEAIINKTLKEIS